MNLVGILSVSAFLLILVFQAGIYFSARKAVGQSLPELDGPFQRKLEKVRKSGLIVFHSPTCGPCKSMMPGARKLADEQPNVLLVDISSDKEAAEKFAIRATPTTLLIHDGMISKVTLGSLGYKKLKHLLA